MAVIDMKGTGKQIRTMRLAAGLTAQAVAEALCFTTPNAVWAWEKGIHMPTLDNIVLLADLFGVTVNDLIVVHRTAG